MTKDENERLAVVETDVKHIIADMSIVKADLKTSNMDMKIDMSIVKADLKTSNDELKVYISHEVNTQKESVGIAMAAAKEANLKSESITSLKLEVSNNVKETMGSEISNMRVDISKRFDDFKDDFNKKIDELKTYQSKQTGSISGVSESKVDLTRYLGWIVSILSIAAVMVTLFIR